MISELLKDAGFVIESHQNIVLERSFENLSAQILALPIEKDLSDAGDAVTRRVVEDVAVSLEKFADNEVFKVPQEAHLFQARV